MQPSNALIQIKAALEQSGAASSDFDLNPDYTPPKDRVLRDAAVLIALRDAPDGVRVVLTKRSSALKHHPGQIAFPGGKRDASETLAHAALREAEEEIGLDRTQVELLGTLPCHETVTGFQVEPHVGLVTGDFTPRPEIGEVAEVFDVPLAHVLNSANYRVEGRFWRGQRRQFYVVPFGPYYIWGATARMLRVLADRVTP